MLGDDQRRLTAASLIRLDPGVGAALYSFGVLSEQFPRALQRLRDATAARTAAADAWNRALDHDLFGSAVHVREDGTGSITVWTDWDAEIRAELTERVREFVTALWDTLDELVCETIEMFAAQHTIRDPTAPRYFPIAIDRTSFDDLLDTSCIDGVLGTHAHLILICQPFANSDDQIATRLRECLGRLLSWSQQLDRGAQMSAWATPESPQIFTEQPSGVEPLHVEQPSEVTEDGIVVARFTLTNHRREASYQGRAGTWLDPYMPGDSAPSRPDDHFPDRAGACERAVLQIAAQFAALAEQAPAARSLLAPFPSADPAPASVRYMTDAEAEALRTSESKVALVVDETGTRSIVVAAPHGIMQRELPFPSPLRAYDRSGDAAEFAVRDAVATWGLPDFAMRPRLERKGPGIREIGDGLVLAGDRGLVLQVKQREQPSDDIEKEHRWVDKQIAKACAQINGSYRRLSTAPTDLVNGRDIDLHIDTTTVTFMGVVIMDHPENSLNTEFTQPPTRIPTIVITRRDWEFLFNQLRSTRAVVDYVFRVQRSTVRLHDEPARYFELAVLDATTPPNAPSPHQIGFARIRSTPQLPLDPVGADDPVAYGMLRLISEDLASIRTGPATPEEMVEALAMLDGLHVSSRVALGRLLLDSLAQLCDDDKRPWRFRTFVSPTPGAPQLSFGTCARFDEVTESAFQSWVSLRHQERAEVEDIRDAVTIGVLLTPQRDGLREWDTTLMVARGDLQLDTDYVARLQALWGARGTAGDAA